MTKVSNDKIEEQRAKVLGVSPDVKLVSPCKINEGILHYNQEDIERFIEGFEKEKFSTCFFTPASGSGSRMFQFLFDFLEDPNEDNRSQVEKFLNHIEDFAFFQQLPLDVRKKLKDRDVELDEFVSFLLKNHGMGYGDLPKGLIPFHKHDPFILTPFQEQILQGIKVVDENVKFHFTVQPIFMDLIRKVIADVQGLTGQTYEIEFSEQKRESNAVAFQMDGEICYDEKNQVLERPGGHGALLENLNEIDADLIFIKNIDNIQHFSKAKSTIHSWKLIGGILLEFKRKVNEILIHPTKDEIVRLNEEYQLYPSEIVEKAALSELVELLNRPVRVCGMVRNEGQPGGGPFWVNDKGMVSKQIVEKAQISMRGEQYRLMVQSSHFNPVFIAISGKDYKGNKIDFTQYKDDGKFFIVRKKYKGKEIRFIELPGLWNGSMAYWNSIFVEIPASTFSPVKTVLDLLDNAHL